MSQSQDKFIPVAPWELLCLMLSYKSQKLQMYVFRYKAGLDTSVSGCSFRIE